MESEAEAEIDLDGRVEADAEALAEAMRAYLEDPASATRDGASGRAFVVENFDRGKISLAFADLMERAAGRR